MARRAKLESCSELLPHGHPKMTQELRVQVTHNRFRNAVELDTFLEVEVSWRSSIMSPMTWKKMCHFRFREPINN